MLLYAWLSGTFQISFNHLLFSFLYHRFLSLKFVIFWFLSYQVKVSTFFWFIFMVVRTLKLFTICTEIITDASAV